MTAWPDLPAAIRTEIREAALFTMEERLLRVESCLRYTNRDRRRTKRLLDRRDRLMRAIEAVERLP